MIKSVEHGIRTFTSFQSHGEYLGNGARDSVFTSSMTNRALSIPSNVLFSSGFLYPFAVSFNNVNSNEGN